MTHEVKGKTIDKHTRCIHYHSSTDVIAVKFKCCNQYFPCYACHTESTDHPAKIWDKKEFDEKAVLCGNCKTELTINEYLNCNSSCPNCSASFNPNCQKHHAYYFDVD